MNKITLASVCSPSEDVVARVIEGELIIVPLAAGVGDMEGELYSMNETGREIWDNLDGKRSLGQIAVDLAAGYDAPLEEIEADILGLVSELARRNMLLIR